MKGTVKCSICGMLGHNATGCSSIPNAAKPALLALDETRKRVDELVASGQTNGIVWDEAFRQLVECLRNFNAMTRTPHFREHSPKEIAFIGTAERRRLVITAQPNEGDTVTIGDIQFRFVSKPVAEHDILLGATLKESWENAKQTPIFADALRWTPEPTT